jgi:chemotaxis response regulator CheB
MRSLSLWAAHWKCVEGLAFCKVDIAGTVDAGFCPRRAKPLSSPEMDAATDVGYQRHSGKKGIRMAVTSGSLDLVVIGSSAGGIEALSMLVATLSPVFLAPLVLAQHLDHLTGCATSCK